MFQTSHNYDFPDGRENVLDKDRDRDGVPDRDDLCADEPRGEQPDPQQSGCPQRDENGD